MTDVKTHEDALPPELVAGVLEDYKVHQIELRRSMEISAGFYDKLVALNAGSIAISVSVGLVILNKQDLRQLSHGFFFLILCFWLSLFSAIVHNYLFRWSAKLDVSYSSQEFIKKTLKRQIATIEPTSGVNGSDLKKLENELQQNPIERQRTTTTCKRWLERIADLAGYVSIITFFVGYTLVVYGAYKLWF